MENPYSGLSSPAPVWRWMGDRGLRLATGAQTLARHAELSSGIFEEIEDIIPADGSLLLILKPGMALSRSLREALASPGAGGPPVEGGLHTIPVCFGGEAGPDLVACAEAAGLSEDDWLRAFIGAELTVAFLGFQPGFPYLAGLPSALQMPRRARPRTRVAAGSVAVGGTYAGIYPDAGPGGWQVIGRTVTHLFDPMRTPPARFAPGDRVRWVAD